MLPPELLHLRGPWTDARAIRDGLKDTRYDRVQMECFNDIEAQEIAALLTPAERARVQFTWLFQVDR